MVPIGQLADRFARWPFLIAMSLLCAVLAVAQALTPPELEIPLHGLTAIFSALAHYGFALAVTNDALEDHERVSAGATLFVCCSLGLILGPVLATEAIETWDPPAFFYFLALVHLAIVAYALAIPQQQPKPAQPGEAPNNTQAASLQVPLASAVALKGKDRSLS